MVNELQYNTVLLLAITLVHEAKEPNTVQYRTASLVSPSQNNLSRFRDTKCLMSGGAQITPNEKCQIDANHFH